MGLQHWLWKLLRDTTRKFGPLHKVFKKIVVDTSNCGTVASTEIFLCYPVAGPSITHKRRVRGLETRLGFKECDLSQLFVSRDTERVGKVMIRELATLESEGVLRSGPGAARTILLLHIISPRPSKQPRMVRTFLKVYMELGSYFLFLQEQIKDIIIIEKTIAHPTLTRAWSEAGTEGR